MQKFNDFSYCSYDYIGEEENNYAKAYVIPQVFENLFDVNMALSMGTIFRDLVRPYYKKENNKCK